MLRRVVKIQDAALRYVTKLHDHFTFSLAFIQSVPSGSAIQQLKFRWRLFEYDKIPKFTVTSEQPSTLTEAFVLEWCSYVLLVFSKPKTMSPAINLQFLSLLTTCDT